MVGVVLISHGGMAEGLRSSASMLTPNVSQMAHVSLWPEDNPDDFQKELEEKIREVDTGDGVIILADLLGGTPSNRAMYFLGEKVRMLAGMSLPMLISLLFSRVEVSDIVALAKTTLEEASYSIVDVNDLMNKGGAKND